MNRKRHFKKKKIQRFKLTMQNKKKLLQKLLLLCYKKFLFFFFLTQIVFKVKQNIIYLLIKLNNFTSLCNNVNNALETGKWQKRQKQKK